MPFLRVPAILAVLCAASLVACGSHQDGATSGAGGGGGAGGSTATTFTPVVHPALPQVLDLGGPVLKSPKVQPIAYGTDPGVADIEEFLKELTQTSYWSETTSEYGVGALTILPTIVRTEAAPAKLDAATLPQDLAANTSGSSPAWGAPDAETIYLFLIPPGTVIGDSSGTGCTDFDGYHSEAVLSGGVTLPYAVGCACPGFDGPQISDLQERTVAISHELIESATDPFPDTHPAYVQEDDADYVWAIASGGELADMCELASDSLVVPPGGTYMVQRSWSNQAAKASANPCVPVITKDPYFNSVPQLPDTLKIVTTNGSIDVPGVKIPVGASNTIDVTLFSDAPTKGPWTVHAADASPLSTGTQYLELTLDKTTGQNGDTLHLTIKVLAADPYFPVEPFVIVSELDGQTNLWMGAVGQ